MHIYGPSQLHGPQPINAPHGAKPAQQIGRPEAPQIADEVDISEAARLVEQVQQSAEGTYETRDKLNVAVERLLDEIG